MGRRLDVDVARQQRVVVHEHLFPRHLDVFAHQHAVAFVVAPGQRRIEFGTQAESGGLARPQRQTRRIARDCAGDRLLLLVGGERDDVADPDLVGVGGGGRQHLHAGDDDAVVVLAHHPQRRRRDVLALIEFRIAGSLRRHHRVRHIDVVVADVAIVVQEVVAEPVRRRQRAGIHRHAGDVGRQMIGRAAEQAVGEIRDPAMAFHAPLQVVARLRAQEIDGMAAAVLLVAHDVAAGGIGLEVVDGGDRLSRRAERRMSGHVVDPLGADIDHAAVAQRFQVLLAGAQHADDVPLWCLESATRRPPASPCRVCHSPPSPD